MTHAKAKLSVSVARDLVRQIDRAVDARRWASRSATMESALKDWAVRERALERDAAIEAYYGGVTADQREEDASFADAAWSGFVEAAGRDLQPAKRKRAQRRARKGA